MSDNVTIDDIGRTRVVTIERPEVRNAVDRPTAEALYEAFVAFDVDDTVDVAILTGRGGAFCAGADLRGIADGRGNRIEQRSAAEIGGSIGPMGPTRLDMSKPVIAAVEGHAVAGGLELAIWCDLRVVADDAIFGVYCRRWGVPLVDGGTVRLPRLIGHGVAMDLILTGRSVDANEALRIGLATRVVPSGSALDDALTLANEIATFPQRCVQSDRRSAIDSWSLPHEAAMAHEVELGLITVNSGETEAGATRFRDGEGRHGTGVGGSFGP